MRVQANARVLNLSPGQVAELERSPIVDGLLARGLLVELPDGEPVAPPEPLAPPEPEAKSRRRRRDEADSEGDDPDTRYYRPMGGEPEET